jgi:hypothetical protein
VRIDPFLLLGQEIEEQGCEPAVLQDLGNVRIARTQPATAASMGEQDDSTGFLRSDQQSWQPRSSREDRKLSRLHNTYLARGTSRLGNLWTHWRPMM